MESKHSAKTDSHITIPRKIEVNMHGESNGINPVEHKGFLIESFELVAQFSQQICQKYLFRKADHKSLYTAGKILNAMLSF